MSGCGWGVGVWGWVDVWVWLGVGGCSSARGVAPARADLLRAARSGTTRVVFGLVIGVRVSNFGPGRDGTRARRSGENACGPVAAAPEAPRGGVFGFFAPKR